MTGTVELRLDAPVRARGVRLRLTGEEFTHITRSTGKTTVTYLDRRPILQDEIVFAGEVRLATFAEGLADAWNTILNRVEHAEIPAGVHRYPFAFTLPEDAPPTYDGSSAEVVYRLLAYVDVPLWTDLRRKQDLMVYPAAQPVGPSNSSTGAYPSAEKLSIWQRDLVDLVRPNVRATLELSRSRYGIGQVIDGMLTVEDTGGASLRGVEFTLTAVEEARAQGTDRVRRQAARVYQSWSETGPIGAGIPFELEIREGIVPTLARPHFSLEWFVQPAWTSRWRRTCRSPLRLRSF